MNELRRKVLALLGGSLEREVLVDVLISFILSEAGRLGGRPRKHTNGSDSAVPKPLSDTDAKPLFGGEGGALVLTPDPVPGPSGPSQTIRKDRRSIGAHPGFDDVFWPAYPRKDAKSPARRAWDRQKPPLDKVMAALEWQCKRAEWQGLTSDGRIPIPMAASWINGHRWEDERPQPLVRRDIHQPPRLA